MQIGRLIYDCKLYEYVCSIAAAQLWFQKETSDKTERSYWTYQIMEKSERLGGGYIEKLFIKEFHFQLSVNLDTYFQRHK
mgnify:CR=1 FL=1